ncbi:HMA2 domain-containing protein [Magnetospirillum molischianum]|uniref:HMA domain-containing protein n=1 Tax=Magnetospirillum molischianum DSM 120 TaxID=1150626 RepID=H8FVQ4_MAGML|nr:hypothetical protein [Magnetospirillum molischianum]CCG42442.1 conserved hypothetical protein [Magnetospirillum molischianum DSM 120]
MVAIASALPGRLRLRDAVWRSPARNEAIRSELAGWDGVDTVEGNPRGGSLLIRYDPARLTPAKIEAQLIERFDIATKSARPASRQRAGWASDEFLDSLATRQANRTAKIGLLASTAVMLLSLGFSKRLHAAAGGVNLALLAVHLIYNRQKMLR